MIERRQFSGGMKGKNLRYLNEPADKPVPMTRAGFLLLEHFSLPAFTQALDTIVTANLLRPGSVRAVCFPQAVPALFTGSRFVNHAVKCG